MRSRIARKQGDRALEARQRLAVPAQCQQLATAVGVQRRVPRLQRQRALDTRQRLGVPARGRPEETEVVMRVGVARVERDRPSEALARFLRTVGTLEGYAQAVARLIIVGREPERLPETRDRFLRFSQVDECSAAATMRHRQIGLQGERALVTRERFGVTPRLAHRSGEVGLHGRVGGLELRGRPEEGERLLEVSERGDRETQQVQGVAIVRLTREHLAVEGDGFGQAPLLMQGECLRHGGSVAGHRVPAGGSIAGRGAG